MVSAMKETKVARFETACGRAIRGFLKERYKRSPNTAIGYEGDISKFLNDVFGQTIDTIKSEELDLLDFESLSEYINSMLGEVANSTINRHISSIKSMLKHLKATNAIKSEISYLELISQLPASSQSYDYMPREVVEQYMEATRFEMHKAEEKRLLIKLAADTALRQAELLSLEWSQFKIDREGRYTITGRGKGNKKFVEIISRELYEEVLTLKEVNKDKVFSLNRKNVQDMMNRLTRILQYEDRNYVFHSFKKAAVTFTYDRTGDINQARKKGKHTNLETVTRYLEDKDTGLMGMFSMSDEVDENLYKEVSHEILLKGLSKVSRNILLILNAEIKEIIDNN